MIEKVFKAATDKISGMAAVYNRYAYREEKAAALTSSEWPREQLSAGTKKLEWLLHGQT